jgi:uncharacterized protein YyaL (SSP411 family)
MAAVFFDYFEIKEKGNWEHGKNILYRRQAATQVAKRHKLTEAALEDLISKAKEKLFKARSSRVRPALDDKALTSWNALMLKGYVDAFRAFGEKSYLEAAVKNGQFILEKMQQKDGRLTRNYKDGKSVINAFLDDYALTAEAFTALYEVTFDEKWLNKARDLTAYALDHFTDEKTGLLYYTSDLDPPLVTRRMETADNVIPGSNSVMAKNLLMLGNYFYKDDWVEKARQMLHVLSPKVTTEAPDFYSNWCRLYLDVVRPPFEVAIVGDNFEAKRNELMRHYLPNALLLGGKDEGSLELLKEKLQEGETLIYVCRDKVCKLPVAEVEKALALMK